MLPPEDNRSHAQSLVFLVHGYAAHFNRPSYVQLLRELLENKIAVATIDLEGHGYSEGLRCFMPSMVDVLDDLEQFVDLVQSGAAILSHHDFYSLDAVAQVSPQAPTLNSNSQP